MSWRDTVEKSYSSGGSEQPAPEAKKATGAWRQAIDRFDWMRPEDREYAEGLSGPDGSISGFVTGSDRDIPSIPLLNSDKVFGTLNSEGLGWENLKTAAGTMAAGDYEARKNIYSENLKSAGIEHEWRVTPNGEEVLRYRSPETGEWQYGFIDRPGFDSSDLAFVAGAVGSGLGIGRAASAIPSVATRLTGLQAVPYVGKPLVGAGLGATESLALDSVAQAAGANRSSEDIAVNAGVSAAAGAALPPLAGAARAVVDATPLPKWAGSAWSSLKSGLSEAKAGKVTAEQKEQAKKIVVESLPEEMRPYLNRQSADEVWALVAKDAYIQDMPLADLQKTAVGKLWADIFPGTAETGPAIPFKANVTGEASDFAALENAQKGAYGPIAQDMANTQAQNTNRAVDASLRGEMASDVTGAPLRNSPENAALVREGVEGRYQQLARQEADAWNVAESSRGVYQPRAVQGLPDKVREGVNPNLLDPETGKIKGAAGNLTPKQQAEQQMLDLVDEWASGKTPEYGAILGPDGSPILTVGGDPVEKTISDLNQLRQALRELQPSENSVTAKAILRSLDDWEDDVLRQGLFIGDDDAIQAYRQARRATRQKYAETTSDPQRVSGTKQKAINPVGKFIEDVRTGRVNDHQIGLRILGGSKLDKVGTKESNQIIDWMVNTFGKDSPELSAVKQMAYRSIFFDGGKPRTADQIVKGWDAMMENGGGTTMQKLFGSEYARLKAAVKALRSMSYGERGVMRRTNLSAPSAANEAERNAQRGLAQFARLMERGGESGVIPAGQIAGRWLQSQGARGVNEAAEAGARAASSDVFLEPFKPTMQVYQFMLRNPQVMSEPAAKAAMEYQRSR